MSRVLSRLGGGPEILMPTNVSHRRVLQEQLDQLIRRAVQLELKFHAIPSTDQLRLMQLDVLVFRNHLKDIRHAFATRQRNPQRAQDVLLEELLLKPVNPDQGDEAKSNRGNGDSDEGPTEGERHTDRGRCPQARRRRETLDIGACSNNRSGSEKADACDDLSGDSPFVSAELAADLAEENDADHEQHVGSHSGGAGVNFTLPADQSGKECPDSQLG